jgi:subtilisin family serine protease
VTHPLVKVEDMFNSFEMRLRKYTMHKRYSRILLAHTIALVFYSLTSITSYSFAKSNYFYSPDLLNSRYTGWALEAQIEGEKHNPSINLLSAWKRFKKRGKTVVAVIDTGIDNSHPFLINNLYISKGRSNNNNYGRDFSKGRSSIYRPTDRHGHGTHISGIIKSVFPDVDILTLKYYDAKASGQDNLSSTIKALRYAVDQNVDIINYSGGGPEPADDELKILKEAERKGILVVAAAGNEKSNIDHQKNAYYPASYGLSNIITVTAHDRKTQLLASANYGKIQVDIFAPGDRIKSSLPYRRAGYLTGTSQSTAFVTGVSALIKSKYPHLKAQQIKKIITKSAYREVSMMSKCRSGGRLDAGKALELADRLVAGVDSRQDSKAAIRELATKKRKGKIIYHRSN